jgi:hypothetical protein
MVESRTFLKDNHILGVVSQYINAIMIDELSFIELGAFMMSTVAVTVSEITPKSIIKSEFSAFLNHKSFQVL